MISLVVIMSAVQQVFIGVISSVIVAGLVGYGSANFAAGESKAMLDSHEVKLSKLDGINARVDGIDSRTGNLEKRFDTFEKLVVEGQKESRDIAYKILGEIAEIRKDTAINSTEIGAIKTDVQEIKESMR